VIMACSLLIGIYQRTAVPHKCTYHDITMYEATYRVLDGNNMEHKFRVRWTSAASLLYIFSEIGARVSVYA